MHPILFTLSMTPGTAQVVGIVASIFLSAFIVFDSWRQNGKEKLAGASIQAVLFLIVALFVSVAFLTPARLPDPIVLDIRGWGIAAIAGMVVCFFIQRWLGREIGLSSEQILSLWVYGGLSAIAGARLLHVAVNWPMYASNPLRAITFWDGGMVYIGGVTAALITAAIYARREGLGFRAFDVLALGVALTQGIGRIGCFLAGCCYGRETDLPWGVSFPAGSIAHFTMVESGVIERTALATPHLHPTQLYEALVCFAIGGLLLYWYKKHTPRPGVIVCAYFIFYSVARFMLELIRNDPERQFLFRWPESAPVLLSTSQTAGILIIVIAIAVLRWKRSASPTQSP